LTLVGSGSYHLRTRETADFGRRDGFRPMAADDESKGETSGSTDASAKRSGKRVSDKAKVSAKESSAKPKPSRKRSSSKNGVRRARIERMMSKAELARRANLSVLTIDRVEKGLGCRMDTKRKILEALELSVADRVRVFGEED
jgi:ribosome-binding protein aMBF1 (putative translation factor)